MTLTAKVAATAELVEEEDSSAGIPTVSCLFPSNNEDVNFVASYVDTLAVSFSSPGSCTSG